MISTSKKLKHPTLWWFQEHKEKLNYSVNALYRCLNISKQAIYQARIRQRNFDTELIDLVTQADILRDEHPGCGVEKMYRTHKPKFMGRDKFCEIFMDLGYRVRTIKNYRKNHYTNSFKLPKTN